jgi:hypothetical protein
METKKILIYAVIVLITGVSIFFYIKKQQKQQNQKKTQEILSKERRDCETGEWSEWSPCSVSCGGGSQSRNRLMKTPSKNGGSCILKETKEGCNKNPCPRDCKVSDWSQFSSCQNVNGVWKKIRTKTVREFPQFNGKECPPLTEEEVCPPVNCQISDWSEYSPCKYDVNERVFKKRRNKTLIQVPLYGGTTCPRLNNTSLTEEEIGLNKDIVQIQEEVCPFIVADTVVPSRNGIWFIESTFDNAYDNNYETSWIPGMRFIRGTEQYDEQGLTGQWLIFKYNNPVNIKGLYINFLLRHRSSTEPTLIVKIYKNVDQSDTSPIKMNADLSNYVFPSSSLVLEKTYTEYRNIILNEKLNLTNINNIMVMFSKDTIVREIQFY